MVEDRLAALGIVVAGDEAARLVEEKQPGLLRRGQRRTVDLDAVVRADIAGGARQQLAVDADPAIEDPGLGVAARA